MERFPVGEKHPIVQLISTSCMVCFHSRARRHCYPDRKYRFKMFKANDACSEKSGSCFFTIFKASSSHEHRSLRRQFEELGFLVSFCDKTTQADSAA